MHRLKMKQGRENITKLCISNLMSSLVPSNTFLVNSDVILGRCRIGVGSMWGPCSADVGSI